jgi:hypothetical protein
MWALLSNPGHADSFEKHGEAYTPLRWLVEQLAHREYAGRVYAFKSLSSFNLTTAPTYQQADGYDWHRIRSKASSVRRQVQLGAPKSRPGPSRCGELLLRGHGGRRSH